MVEETEQLSGGIGSISVWNAAGGVGWSTPGPCFLDCGIVTVLISLFACGLDVVAAFLQK
jgi:hypothetical protein